ncbi:MAG TPA: DUF2442 domain-containing protein [Ruminococcaceae bacterium]|nr:DUF2442 domain-containing protein [Oscillospiraceae bacterium]
MMPKVRRVVPIDGHLIRISYETGEERVFDVSPYMTGSWYGKLKDPVFFSTVHPAGRTVAWAGGQDIAPHELYELSRPLQHI